MKQNSQDSEKKRNLNRRRKVREEKTFCSAEGGKTHSPLAIFATSVQTLPLVFMLLAVAVEALAVNAPQSYDFEGLTSNSLLSSVSGWDASSNSVVVLPSNAIPVAAGTNAVLLPVGTTASNLVQSTTPTKVWTDLQYNEALHMMDGIPVEANTNVVFQFYMTTNGSVTVYDRAVTNWVSYSTDVWGYAVSDFAPAGWLRLSVLKNYATRKADVFVNGHLIRTQLDFINTNRNTYTGFTLQGGVDYPSYLDEVGVLTNAPSNLTTDVDLDGMADAQEMQTYGNLSTWRRWTNTVSITGGGTVMNGTQTYSNGSVVVNSFLADPGFGISSVQTNVGSNVGNVNCGGDAKSGTVSYVINTDITFTVTFMSRTQWSVPADVPTLTRAVSVAVAGDTLIASNGLNTSESITLDKALTLTGTNVTLNALAVSNGVPATMNSASNWVIGAVQVTNAAVLIVTNSTVTFTSLSFGVGGVVRVYNSTVTANGLTLTGTFTLDSTFGVPGVTASHLNFRDDFELYALSTPLNLLGMFGWSASSASVIIQSNTTYLASGRAALLPAISSITNTISSAGYSNVWTEFYLNDSNHMVNGTYVEADTNAVVQFYLNTNNYVVLYNREAASWDICSNDVWGSSLAGVCSNGWTYLAVNQNYATKQAALFLNGHLVRQQVAFINTNQGSYARFQIQGCDDASAYVDSVGFSTNVPASLTNGPARDLDLDGIPDAVEIAERGTVGILEFGSVFKFR